VGRRNSLSVSTSTKLRGLVIASLNEYKKGSYMNRKVLRTNRGGKYFSSDFSGYPKCLGILHEKTNPRTPQENGVAERVNRTLVSMGITMLKTVKSNLEARCGHMPSRMPRS
jgi:transposase InsO family protein